MTPCVWLQSTMSLQTILQRPPSVSYPSLPADMPLVRPQDSAKAVGSPQTLIKRGRTNAKVPDSVGGGGYSPCPSARQLAQRTAQTRAPWPAWQAQKRGPWSASSRPLPERGDSTARSGTGASLREFAGADDCAVLRPLQTHPRFQTTLPVEKIIRGTKPVYSV